MVAKKKKPIIRRKKRRTGLHRIRIGNVWWTLVVVPHPISEVYGYASIQLKLIVVDGTLSDERFMDTIIHEFGHALEWGASEKSVKRRGQSFARILTELGYAN